MTDKLHVTVDITSDVVCPWCWIGKKHLDSAIHKLSNDFVFHIHWKPFLLNPHMPDEGVPLEHYVRNKFGDAAGQRFLSGDSPVAQSGKAAGITFTSNRLVVPTRKAHLLLAHAAKLGKQHDLHERLFQAYFSEGKNIANEDILREIVTEEGLDGNVAMATLKDSDLNRRYEEELMEANRKGITGVPYFEIYIKDRAVMVQSMSGAQPVDTFVALFKRLRLLPKV